MAQRKTRTVSLPPALDKRMDKFSDENWSAVASQAFEVRVTQLESMNATENDINATIARLRASKKSATNELHQRGEAVGADYVMRDADWAELERLRLRVEDGKGIDEDATLTDVLNVMDEDGQADPQLYQSFREHEGDDIDNPVWAGGFVAGVLKRYSEIRNNL